MATAKVSEIMTTNVATASAAESFSQVARLLSERQVSALPVVDSGGHVIGVVSEADLLRKEEIKGIPDEAPHLFGRRRARRTRSRAEATAVAGLMNSPAITTTPGAKVTEAARTLAAHGIKRLPVVDEHNRLVGIVSRADLLKVFLKSDAEIAAMVADKVILHGMWMDPKKITIEVEDGVVTLTGEVEQRSLIPVVVDLTAAQDGVVGVVEHLTYSWDDTTAEARHYRR